MGKTIRLTEDQIRRFFGEGFGKRLIGEGNSMKQDMMKRKEQSLNTNKAKTIARKKYSNTMGHTDDRDEDSMYHRGFHYTPREGNDFPGYGFSVAKMADFGQADLTDENSIGNNELLSAIKELHGNGPLNLIDVLDILHQLKDKKVGSGDAGKEAFDFLNTINIDYILSNFVTVNAPDYVFWRLKNLTPKEIQNIRETYKKDFSQFGQRCDGCGIREWKTTVTPFEHDDSHINLEYMGSAAADKPVSINESGGPREFHKFPVPFQIHHMNENAGDNSPLNLSCLCPNCHALTGSYGRPKGNMGADTLAILSELENMVGGESGATGSLAETLMSSDEKKKIVNSLKRGEFERRDVTNSIMGVGMDGGLELDSSDPELLEHVSQFGVSDPKKFIEDFNNFFMSIWDEGLEEYKKHHELKESVSLNEEEGETEDDSNEPTDMSSVTDGILDGVKYTYEVRCSKLGNVTLFLYAGETPLVFGGFKNNYISLTPMYYEDETYREKAKNEIRNRVLGAVLNSMAQIKKGKMSKWETPSWTKDDVKDANGKVVGSRVVADRIKNMKPSGDPSIVKDKNGNYDILKSPTGLLDAQSMFPSQKSDDYSVGKSQNLAAKKQARQKTSIPNNTLEFFYTNLGNQNLKSPLNGDGKPKYQQELIDYIKNTPKDMSYDEFLNNLLQMGLVKYK